MAITVAMRTEVAQNYVALFGRAPDTDGLSYWVQQLGAGASHAAVAQAMYDTEPARAYFPGWMTNEEIVSSFYTNVLGRSADAEGLAYWAGRLAASSAGDVIREMVNAVVNWAPTGGANDAAGATAKALFNNKVAVANYWGTTVGTVAGSDTVIDAVTATTDTSSTAAIAAFVESNAAPVAGQTFTLTASTNNFTGGAGDDTFDGAFSSTGGITFNPSDALDGGAGNDTLNATFNAAGTYQAAVLKNIESLAATFTTVASTLSLNGATGYTSVEAQGSTVDAAFSGINSTAVALKVSNTTTDATFGFSSSALTGTADAVTVTVSNVNQGANDGIELTAGVETLNLVSSGSANVVDEIESLTTDTITKIVVTGDQSLKITDNLETTVVTLDASAATGAVDVDFGAAAVTVTGGAGNDSFSFEATGAVSVSGGAGNDTLKFDGTGTLTSADTVAGGDGTDTLESTAAEAEGIAAVLTNITGIESVKLTDAGTAAAQLDAADFGSGVSKVVLGAGTGDGTYTINFNAGASTLDVTGAIGATDDSDVTLTASGTATDDSLTVNYKSTTTDIAEDLVTTGIETLTLSNTDGTADTLGNLTMTASTNGTTKLVLQGNKGFTGSADSYTVSVIDASGLTGGGAIAFVMGAAAASGLTSITGSAGNDTLLGDASSSIDAGAGNDSVVGGSGNDTLVGGDGNDSITGAAGNDSINGGAGNDTITMGDNLATAAANEDIIDGGDGTDRLSVTNTSLTALNALSISNATLFNNSISNIEEVYISNDLDQTSFDMARLDSITKVRIGDWAGAESLVGLAAASTLTLVADGTTNSTDDLTVALADASGSADALTIALVNDADNTNFGDVTIASIESLTITTAEATATSTAETFTLDLTSTGLTTLTITGTEELILEGVAVNATTINASGNTGMVKILGGSANQTITGTASTDSINGGAGADTIDGGAGVDTILGGTGADSITGGAGADIITGGAGNDTIVLTEDTAAVDDVVIDYSELGANVDTVTGFTTGSSGDEIQLDLSALETAGTSGVFSSAVNFVENDTDDTSDGVSAAAASVQVMTGAATLTDEVNLLVLSGATFGSADEVEDALETGGAFAVTASTTGGAPSFTNANNAFVVVWSDGTNAHVSAVHVVTETTDDADFETGDLNVINLVGINGVASIASTTFGTANFEWIA